MRELRGSPTEAEKAAWKLLRDRRLGAKFRRQFPAGNGVLDFYCFEQRLAIELDGGVHSQINQMRRDAGKEDYLRTLGIRLLRIPNAMVLEHPDEFVRTIVDAMGPVTEKARKEPLTRLAPAGNGAGGEPPSPRGEGKTCSGPRACALAGARGRAQGESLHLLPRGEGGRRRRFHQPARAG